MKHYIVTVIRKQEAEIVVQAESQEEAFDLAEKCIPPSDTEWHDVHEPLEVDREDWDEEQLEAVKVTAYKSISGDAIMPCADSSVVGSEAEKKKRDREKALYDARYPMSNFLDAYEVEIKKREEKKEPEE
jgi:hypothetical protein